MNNRVLILGASSWIGYLLANSFSDQGFTVLGTIFKTSPLFNKSIKVTQVETSNLTKYSEIFELFNPDIVINLLRGEDLDGFNLHKYVIEFAAVNSFHYLYASSILALDGYNETQLIESLEPLSKTEYGLFKAKCERELSKSNISHTIVRFSSVQGWVPHRPTRNESFLSKLVMKQPISVDTGVYQNRILASKLVDALVHLSKDRVQGVVHIGSSNSSEELIFLKRQAKLFGHSEQLVTPGLERNINLIAVPNRIYDLYGDEFMISEDQTLQGLLDINGLKKYIKLRWQ